MPTSSGAPEARGGVIDLSQWNFEREGLVRLNGQWEFYWDRLIEPEQFEVADPPKPDGFLDFPSRWNGYEIDGEELSGRGVATLRLVVLHRQSDRIIGLKMLNMATSYRLYGDGRLLAKNGIVSSDPDEARPQYLPKTAEVYDGDGRLELVLQIANFEHRSGGAWYPMYVGPVGLIKRFALGKAAFQVFLLGVLLVMGFYHLLLYALRRSDPSPLFFGLFSLIVAVRVLFTEEYLAVQAFPDLSWQLVVRLEFLSLYVTAPPLVAFLRTLFPNEFSKGLLLAIAGISAAFSLVVLVTPVPIFVRTLIPFEVFGVIAWFVISVSLARAWLAKRRGARLFAAGWIAFFATIINDVLGTHGVLTTIMLFPLGFAFFVLVQAVLLSRRFTGAIEEIAAMSRDLDRKNVELSRLNEELRRQVADRSRQLSDAMARLAMEDRAQTSVAEGDVIDDRYRVLRKIGAGGMGSVYEVERQSDARRLALKILEGEKNFGALSRFAREAQVAAEVTHRNLVQVVDVAVSSAGQMYLVMELIEGRSLDAVPKPVDDLEWALAVLRQMAEGLAALHAAGVVHRDLKPSNVLIEQSAGRETVKIVDFGIARVMSAGTSEVGRWVSGADPSSQPDLAASSSNSAERTRQASATAQTMIAEPSVSPSASQSSGSRSSPAASDPLTQTGALLGTPLYMAPEAVGKNTRGTQRSADLFSFGLIAWELLTDTMPFDEPPVFSRLRGASPGQPRSLSEELGAAPAELVALIDRCVALDPDARPTAEEAVTVLGRIESASSAAEVSAESVA